MPKFLFYDSSSRIYRLYNLEKDGRGIVDSHDARRIGEMDAEAVKIESLMDEATISLEKDLQNFIFFKLDSLEDGLMPYEGANSLEYPVKSGRIDILAKDTIGRPVVIELKAGTASEATLTQILAYIADITHNTAEKQVRGMIIAYRFAERLITAASILPNLELVKYKVNFEFEKMG